MVQIWIPPTLRKFCGGEDCVEVQPGTVARAIFELHGRFHGVQERLCNREGQIRGSILVYVNAEDIRFLSGAQTQLQSGDQVTLVPAFAGG